MYLNYKFKLKLLIIVANGNGAVGICVGILANGGLDAAKLACLQPCFHILYRSLLVALGGAYPANVADRLFSLAFSLLFLL